MHEALGKAAYGFLLVVAWVGVFSIMLYIDQFLK